MKKIIYDFDGTLTKNPIPFYKCLRVCGINSIDDWIKKASVISKKDNIDMYEALFDVYFLSIKQSGLPLNDETFLMGIDEIVYCDGVLDFFKNTKNIDHYILSSGYDKYIKNTLIAPYVKEVYGTSYVFENNTAIGVNELMSDLRKPEKIDLIANDNYDDVIYVGDGLTDLYAFKHILDKGGKAVLVYHDNDLSVYEALKKEGIDIPCFNANYEVNSELYNYLVRGEL